MPAGFAGEMTPNLNFQIPLEGANEFGDEAFIMKVTWKTLRIFGNYNTTIYNVLTVWRSVFRFTFSSHFWSRLVRWFWLFLLRRIYSQINRWHHRCTRLLSVRLKRSANPFVLDFWRYSNVSNCWMVRLYPFLDSISVPFSVLKAFVIHMPPGGALKNGNLTCFKLPVTLLNSLWFFELWVCSWIGWIESLSKSVSSSSAMSRRKRFPKK